MEGEVGVGSDDDAYCGGLVGGLGLLGRTGVTLPWSHYWRSSRECFTSCPVF